MSNIVVLYDTMLTQKLWEVALRESLGDLYDKQSVEYVELKVDTPSSIQWSTETVDGVREARGDPEHIKSVVGDAEILMIHFAPVTADVMDAARNLKIISSARGGPVNVDPEAATQRGIIVTHTIGRLAQPVADHTMGLLLAEVRHIARDHAKVMDGSYFEDPQDLRRSRRYPVREMEGKTLGIVGFGAVGRELAKRARGFNLNVLAFDPYVEEEEMVKQGVQKADLETLLKSSDFVSINARESPQTYHMISREEFKMMKSTSYIVNTSRGSIIDEQALVEALRENMIAGAGIDVFEDEPLKQDNPLLKLGNVTITPHTAGGSDMSRVRSVKLTCNTVAMYLKGEGVIPAEVVNREVLNQ